MFVDMETGTIINGPIMFVDDAGYGIEYETMSDAEIVKAAEYYGSKVIYEMSEPPGLTMVVEDN